MLKVRNIVSGYSGRPVLKNLSLHVAEGEIVAIIGANGAGKTTLLNSIAGLIKPEEGEVILKGTTLCQNRSSKLASRAAPQFPKEEIFSFMSVKENLMLDVFIRQRKTKHFR